MNIKFLIVLSLLIILFFWTSFSAINNFEGELTANQLTFTLDEKQQFLKSFDEIDLRKIVFWGLPEIDLSGEKFIYESLPEFNTIKTLEAKKENNSIPSRVEIKSFKQEENNNLKLLLLELSQSVKINDFKYNNKRNLISFCINFEQSKNELCSSQSEGIERLYNISLTSKGIKVLFDGNARKVLTGLNFKSPGYNIRGEWLAKFMSKEQRIAIIGFLIRQTIFFG